MDMPRADIEALATAAGLCVTSAVSSKTALVVAADPYSQSGKAATARKLGIRLVAEQVFLHQLDQYSAIRP
jgi:DNA polymerase III subunit epsilon